MLHALEPQRLAWILLTAVIAAAGGALLSAVSWPAAWLMGVMVAVTFRSRLTPPPPVATTAPDATGAGIAGGLRSAASAIILKASRHQPTR